MRNGFFSWTCERCGCAPIDLFRCSCGHLRTIYASGPEAKRLASFTLEDAMRDMREAVAIVNRSKFRVIK